MEEYENPGNPSPPRRSRRRRRAPLPLRILAAFFKVLGTLLLVGFCTGALMACFAVAYIQTVIIPQTDLVLTSFDPSLSSTMYYTDKYTGQEVEMLSLHGEENRVWVDYNQIPQNLINATIAIEDKRFYSHHGVDWIRTGYGMLSMLTGKDIQGGSTITQQLIKNTTQENEVTVKRKIFEIFRALELEKNTSKDDILEWYLNFIYLGEGCNGVYTASMNYFGKEVQDLTLAECASLISITNNPSLYNPYRYPENNLKRRNLCLDLMCDQGMITEAQRDAAKAEPLNLVRAEGTSQEQVTYTWYEDQVINDVIKSLTEKYPLTEKGAKDMLYYGGLRIETCFDPEVQAYVDAVYQDRSTLVLNSAKGQEIQSAITVIDNRTGYVVALAGGIGEKESSRLFNRATDTVRPPGSSIKPLAVYAPALDMEQITPATVFDDMPINLNGSAWPSNSYNYYKGLTTVYEALEDSVNTIAVRVLRDCVTPNVSYQYMTEKFGITSLVSLKEINGYVYSDIDLAPLALGGLTEGVSTYEMAAAYATFANNGMYRQPHTYLRVTDANGNVLLENSSAGTPVLRERTVYYINTMLKNVIINGTGHDARFSGMTIAGKTGTTTSNNDKWFVGYSHYYTAAVWVGYDIQERIPSNSYLAAQMWKKVMEPLHEGLENVNFQEPDDIVSQQYCLDSGMLATEWCTLDPRGSRVTTGSFVAGDQPTGYCTVHVPVEICKDSPILDANGAATGRYHLAGEFCPEESRAKIALLDYDRERASANLSARDDAYLLSALSAAGTCTVHTAAPVEPPLEFDIENPETWPVDDPNFDPDNPLTWPGAAEDPSTEDPGAVVPTPPFVDLEDPTATPPAETTPPPVETPSAETPPPAETPPTETPPPAETPPQDEPFVPANGDENEGEPGTGDVPEPGGEPGTGDEPGSEEDNSGE